jgi:hypothetical protein
MIASGGLSGGLSSSIAGGNFWDGFRQGIITSGLNHAMNHMAQEIKIRNVLRELEKNYPKKDDYPDSKSLYKLIGGPMQLMHDNDEKAGKVTYRNTCTVRLSRSLNYTKGLEIPENAGEGIRTFKGGDNKNYIISAIEMAKYLTENFGKKSFYNGTEFTPRNGIIAMYAKNIEGSNVFHVDLIVKGKWIGTSDMHPTYFKIWY